jgi:hypothetical protein
MRYLKRIVNVQKHVAALNDSDVSWCDPHDMAVLNIAVQIDLLKRIVLCRSLSNNNNNSHQCCALRAQLRAPRPARRHGRPGL